MPRVERDQPAGGVQHVGGRGVQGVDVADGVAQHHRHPVLGGEPEHRLGAGPIALPPVVDDLEHQPAGAERRPPGVQVGEGEIDPAGGQRPAHRGAGTEQRDQAARVLGRHRQRAHRLPAGAAQMGGTGEPAQRPPAVAVTGEEGRPGQPRVDAGPTAGGRPAGVRHPHPGRHLTADRGGEGRGQRGVQCGSDRQVHPEDRPHARRPAGEGELHRAVEPVAVGECQCGHAVVGSTGHEIGGVVGPVPHGVTGSDVQMDEGVAHLPLALGGRSRAAAAVLAAPGGAEPGSRARRPGAVRERAGCRGSSPPRRGRSPTSRTRSSASRSVTACESPASAAARLPAPAAKKVAHSPSSGVTWPSSTQALRGRPRAGSGRVRAASTAAAARSAARCAVAYRWRGIDGAAGLGETAVRLVEELGGRGGQRARKGQLAGGRHGAGGAHQSCTRTSHQRFPAASQDRS